MLTRKKDKNTVGKNMMVTWQSLIQKKRQKLLDLI